MSGSYTRIRPRRGTSYEWTTLNPLLYEGELGVEVPSAGVGTGLSRFKIGDGINHWNDLPYAFDGTAAASINGGSATEFSVIQLRAAAHQTWIDANPTLATNEISYDTTYNSIKVGDGVTDWENLPYIVPGALLSDVNNNWSGTMDFGNEDAPDTIVGLSTPTDIYTEGTGNTDYVSPLLPEGWDDEINNSESENP